MTNAATNAATETKQPSKMDQCKALYDEVFAPGYDLEGKSQRAVFIKRAIDELGMTKNGANTYYQNISNAKRGQPLYKYNRYEGKGTREGGEGKAPAAEEDTGLGLPPVAAPTKSQVKAAESTAIGSARDLSQRWQLKNPEGEVVNSFSSRDKVKRAAVQAGEGFTWVDANA